MQPLPITTSGGSQFGTSLAHDISAAPKQRPDVDVGSLPFLYQPDSFVLRVVGFNCSSDCLVCEREAVKAGEREREQDMTLEVIDRFLSVWLPTCGGVTVAGLGEPLLAQNWEHLARGVLAAGKTLHFFTNGKHLDTKLTDCLGDGTNVRVSISLDAGDEKTYVRVGRGKPGEFAKTLDAVRAFRAKCPAAHLSSQFTANLLNQPSFPDFMRLACGLFSAVDWRMTQHHVTAREDLSLRFARSMTEDTLNRSWQMGEDHNHAHPEAPIQLNAERRTYSGFSADALTTPELVSDPASRLQRYLDFAPMSDIPCPGCTPSSSVVGHTPSMNTTYTISGCNGCHTLLTTESGTNSGDGSSFNSFGETVACTSVGTTDLASDSSIVCTTSLTYSDNGTTTGTTTSGSVCETFSCGQPTSVIIGPDGEGQYTTKISDFVCAGNCTTIRATTTGIAEDVTNTTSTGTCGSSDGGPVIIRSVKVPRSKAPGFQAESTDAPAEVEKPVKKTASAPVIYWDGTLTLCYADQRVGNILTDTPDEFLARADVQTFLHRREGREGGIVALDSCRNCPRTF